MFDVDTLGWPKAAPATLRLTTVRDGGKMVTLKEVDVTDDTNAVWLVRNRTTLERVE